MRLSSGAILAVAAMAAAAIAVAAWLGCDGTPRPGTPAALDVAFAGCQQVHRGPICHLEETGELRLWARTSAAARLEIEGEVRVVAAEETPAGKLFRLRPEASSGTIKIVARGETGLAASWLLAWRPPVILPAPLERATGHFAAGHFEEAARELADLTASDDAQGAALRWLGRLERARGDVDAA